MGGTSVETRRAKGRLAEPGTDWTGGEGEEDAIGWVGKG